MSLGDIFKALSDDNRRKILDLLKEGDMTSGEIANHFNMSKPGISQHLSILKNSELVISHKQGQYVYYSLNTTVLQDIMKWAIHMKSNKGGEE
ncbi:autorepressor SdpR family transcription factor [Cytobacillus dafuensis]|uniref:Winged helix-turn-helix transcriptional regulator n=1 Tax=Cytobacillus dafuensis TaxID=1742359 RepID=A0A5B8Z2G9_CYTDA|nr:autorepressor SdpR family transcription factor [Cytobacillus dafuensis]QED47017.1 winged helix-turn-helix transcriptional regulator [Cytobacillus dafuensis]